MNNKLLTIFKRSAIFKWLKFSLPKLRYTKYFKRLKIDEKTILLESQHGTEISGNMFYLLKHLATDEAYKSYKIYVTCRMGNKAKFETVFEKYGIEGVTPVILSTFRYMKLLASAKYLFNDNTFLPFYLKKEGQIYLNTWHGTPLKTLGKGIRNAMHGIGNAQKNFIAADYLLYPNKYTMEHMIEDYMLENVALGKAVLGGYPRNTAFFNKERGQEILDELEIKNKRVYAYMPTWRGSVGNIDAKANAYFQYYLYELDKILADDEIVYLNLHPIAKKDVDFTTFKHIRNFPSEYETYDFLNCAECLVTDYSSVFYDYAVTGKKIILFTFDEEDYFADRGVYKPLSDLPFTKVKTVEDLLSEMRSPKNYDDKAFLEEYCAYDCPEATKALLDFTIFGKKSDRIEEVEIAKNGKKNILLYLGNLDQNGITTSGVNLLNNLDPTEYNYYVSFPAERGKLHQDTIANLPKGVNYIPVQGVFNLSLIKKTMWLNFNRGRFPLSLIMLFMKKEWQYEIQRIYGGAPFDSAIQFNGYVTKMILLFSQFKCNNSIYVHSDMVKERELKGNQRKSVLRYAYKNYDNVALVTEDIFESTSSFVRKTDNFKTVHNIIAYDEIVNRGKAKIKFDEGITQSNKELSEIEAILDSDAKVLISVGRFSPEKDHKRMINAFNNVWKENNNVYFIIIGGIQRDGIYDDLCEYVKTLPCKDNIVLILSMTNPLPIVKKCDGFILASHYEGFGLVLAEADILGLPVVSTDITGPRTFMKKNNGTLVENTQEGVEKGFKLLVDGKVPMLTTDYREYNKNAIAEFKSLID